jgi:hypothetical protein
VSELQTQRAGLRLARRCRNAIRRIARSGGGRA